MTHPCPKPSIFARLPNHDYWAAYFEAEGCSGYPEANNPYQTETMAASRWNAGYRKAEGATLPNPVRKSP